MPTRRVNVCEPGSVMFATTNVLGFANVFSDGAAADQCAAALMQVHRHHGAALVGFVVMPDHVHFVTRLPEDVAGAKFVHSLKTASAAWLLPFVTDVLRRRMATDREHRVRGFWAKGCHCTPITSQGMLEQKLRYIHDNPVRAGMVADAREHRWSSCEFYASGVADPWVGLQNCPVVLERWSIDKLPPLGTRR